MLKYRFECTDEVFTRRKFQDMMMHDQPCGKGVWGNDLYGPGIHFTGCEKRVKGYHLDRSEDGSSRGVPTRISFSGSFTKKGGKTFFQVYIFPNFLQIIFLIAAFLMLIPFSNWVCALFVCAVFAIYAVGYHDDIKKTVAGFQQMVR